MKPAARRIGVALLLAGALLVAPALAQGPSGSSSSASAGAPAPMQPSSQTADVAREASTLVVYVRDGCPHCAAAKDFLPGFVQARPGLRLEFREVDRSEAARDALVRIARESGQWPPGVPTFVYRGQVLVGFGDAAQSGPELARLVDRSLPAAAPGAASGPGAAAAADAGAGSGARPQAAIDTGLAGRLRLDTLGLPLFTLAVGLVDGFNPCAMWVLLFLLSLLVHTRDRRRMALIAGTFVLVSGAVYYAFMAAWLNLFLAVGLSGPLRIGLALLALGIAAIHLKDFAIGLRGPSLSIPDAAKPGLYARMRAVMQAPTLGWALLGVAALAVAVNLVELLCTAGLPAMYTAILTQQGLAPAAHYGYLGLYILGYIADDSLMVGTAVLALSQRKLDEGAGRWLKGLSGAVMLALGAVMLLRPEWLF